MQRKQSSLVESIRKAYARKGLVLVLGAGVSQESGIPSWDGLLRRLAIEHGLESLFDQMRSDGFSLASIAGALEDHYETRDAFTAAVRRALYPQTLLANTASVVSHARRNDTLKAIAAICTLRRGDAFQPNSQIRCVVTFNLDTLLESFANFRYQADIMRPIEHPAISSTPKLISVYHIHGVVPYRSYKVTERVVLTEHDYFDFFGEPFGAFSYTFLYLLREYTCVFIGLSMRDDNLRRLLHYSVRERRAALMRAGAARKANEAAKRHFTFMLRRTSELDTAIEEGLARLGVRVIWLNMHAELLWHLQAIYEGSGERWDNVT